MSEQQEPIDFTEEHAVQVLRDHISIVTARSIKRYGAANTMDIMEQVLRDREIIRRETTWRFDASLLESREFAVAVPEGDGYVIAVHPWFEGKTQDLSFLIAYHLATVNYGEGVIRASEAELFGATLLALDVENFYERMCSIADSFHAAMR